MIAPAAIGMLRFSRTSAARAHSDQRALPALSGF